MSGYGIPIGDDPDERRTKRGHTPGFEGRRRIQEPASVWDVLADISSQMSAERRREAEVEREELRPGESSGILLAQRLHASRDRLLNLQLSNGDDVDLRVLDASKYWVRGQTPRGETLIPITGIATVRGLPLRAGEWSRRLVSESSFQMALRAAMSHGLVVLTHVDGSLRGRIVAVGSDWVDLLVSARGVGSLEAVATNFITIPTARIVRVDVPVRARP